VAFDVYGRVDEKVWFPALMARKRFADRLRCRLGL
jgi:hypothetical protein